MKKLLLTFFLGLVALASAAPVKRHLHIFVGENNMTTLRPEVIVPMDLRRDPDLRREEQFWTKEIRSELSMHDLDDGWKVADAAGKKKYGANYKVKPTKVYERLVKRAQDLQRKKPFDTVILYWMQGESDAKNGWGDEYEANFNRIFENLKKDLGQQEIKVVITRLSDHGTKNKRYPDWEKVRKAQENLVRQNTGWILIDTDDKNGQQDKLEFDKKGKERMIELFVEVAKEFITGKKAVLNPESKS